MGEHNSTMSEQPKERESRDKTGSRADFDRECRAGERSKRMREHSEWMIDETLDESFPASDPPAWTSGVAPPVRSARSHDQHTKPDARELYRVSEAAHEERDAAHDGREIGKAQHAQPPPRPPLHRMPRHAEPGDPGTAFWDRSADERAEEHRRSARSPSRDDASTDMIGRRDAPEGPHETFPGEPRSPEHREHAGAAGDALPLHRWSRDALYDQARGMRIKGRSRMTKAQLVEAVRAAQQSQSK